MRVSIYSFTLLIFVCVRGSHMLRNTPALDGQVCSKLCYLRLVYSRVDSSSGYQAFYFALCCMLSMRFLSSQFQSIAAERLVTKRGKKIGVGLYATTDLKEEAGRMCALKCDE